MKSVALAKKRRRGKTSRLTRGRGEERFSPRRPKDEKREGGKGKKRRTPRRIVDLSELQRRKEVAKERDPYRGEGGWRGTLNERRLQEEKEGKKKRNRTSALMADRAGKRL